jgi:hypothetical protein
VIPFQSLDVAIVVVVQPNWSLINAELLSNWAVIKHGGF